MARGLFTIESVVNLGGSPTEYLLTVNSSAGVVVDDHVGTRLAGGAGAIYSVLAVPSSTTIHVKDDLTEAEPGEFGQPLVDIGPSGAFGTSEQFFNLTQLPFDAPGWDAATRRNTNLLDQAAAGLGEAKVSVALDVVLDIDATVMGQTTLFTPGTNPHVITRVVLIMTQGAGDPPAEVSVGTNGTWDNFVAQTALTAFNTVDSVYQFDLVDRTELVTTPLVLDVKVPSGGTSGPTTFNAYTFGWS